MRIRTFSRYALVIGISLVVAGCTASNNLSGSIPQLQRHTPVNLNRSSPLGTLSILPHLPRAHMLETTWFSLAMVVYGTRQPRQLTRMTNAVYCAR